MHSIIRPDLKLCIVGAGGFGKETLCNYIDIIKQSGVDYSDVVIFAEEAAFWTERKIHGVPVLKLNEIDIEEYAFVIAIGDPAARKRIAVLLPGNTAYATLVHPSVICSEWVTVGEGSILCAGTILTCDIKLGKHTHLNLNTTVGHDSVAGDYFTTAPGVAISGHCTFGDNIYLGSNTSIRQKTRVTDDVTIGMGTVVVKDILEPGTYVGNPAKKIS